MHRPCLRAVFAVDAAALGSLGFMSPMRIRRQLVSRRRQLTVVVALLLTSASIAAHHSGMATGDADHEMGMGAAIEMCLGAFTAVGTAVVAVALGLIALGRWRPPACVMPTGVSLIARPPLPRARAGPSLRLQLCVDRR